MSITKRLRQYLEQNEVPYTSCTHPLAYTAQEVAATQHVAGQEMAKTVVVRADEVHVLVVLPATRKIDMESLSEELPFEQVEIAEESEFASLFPDVEIGAMSPFGNLYHLPVFVDESLTRDDEIVFNAGSHVETIRMKYRDFERLVKPQVISAAVSPHNG